MSGFRNNSSRDEVTTGSGTFQDASRGILRMAGGWGNVSGPGLFMVRTLMTGTLNAVTFGIVGASMGALVYGTAALPFLFSSCFGFIFGALGFYRDAVSRSMKALARYPSLLQLHLDENFSWKGWDRYDTKRLTPDLFRNNWQLKSMLICAWLSAQPALDEINEKREELIVEEAAVQDHKVRGDETGSELT